MDEAQAGIKIAGRNINNLRYTDDTTLMAESEELKSFLMIVKEESEKLWLKTGLKLNIQKTKITVTDFILGGSKLLQMVSAPMKLKEACSLEENL